MRIAVGADINGYELKEVVKAHLAAQGHEVIDFGVDGGQDVDYPEVAEPVARAVARGEVDRAVLVCGTGLGMAIVANKVRGVRAAPVYDRYSAKMSRIDNDANVLCLGGRTMMKNAAFAKKLVDLWLGTKFSKAGRHVRRLKKIAAYERRATR